MTKSEIFKAFGEHVSSGKVKFYRDHEMDFVMGEREGPWNVDVEGEKKLFNLHCNGGVFNLGHRNPEVIAALQEALTSLDIGNHHFVSEARAALASMLAGLMPGDLDYVVFGVSGGEASDLALKVARGYTGRTRIISATGGYHGHTGLALAAGDARYRKAFGIALEGFSQVPFNDLDALSAALDQDTAAVILETIPATLGMPQPAPDYLPGVRTLCDQHGTLLILDEVQAGLGRTGKLWAFEHYDVLPDIVILGKGLSGGIYPITATVLRRPLEAVFHPDPFIHISTFGGSELGCKVAQRVLEISSQPDFLAHVNALADAFAEGVEALKQTHPKLLIGLRQKGLMMGLELENELAGPALTKLAFDHGLLMVYANHDKRVCQLLPPLVMALDDVPMVMERLDQALTAADNLFGY